MTINFYDPTASCDAKRFLSLCLANTETTLPRFALHNEETCLDISSKALIAFEEKELSALLHRGAVKLYGSHRSQAEMARPLAPRLKTFATFKKAFSRIYSYNFL